MFLLLCAGTGKTLALLSAALAWQQKETRADAAAIAAATAAAAAPKDPAQVDIPPSQPQAPAVTSGSKRSGSAPRGDKSNPAGPRRPRPPTVYYVSRTHSQLSQVVKELKTCAAYMDCDIVVAGEAGEPSAPPAPADAPTAATSAKPVPLSMTILASREHLCIHPTVSQSKTRDEVSGGLCGIAKV